MLYKEYFKNKKLSQEIFNKKINWFYDIKSILYQENKQIVEEPERRPIIEGGRLPEYNEETTIA